MNDLPTEYQQVPLQPDQTQWAQHAQSLDERSGIRRLSVPVEVYLAAAGFVVAQAMSSAGILPTIRELLWP